MSRTSTSTSAFTAYLQIDGKDRYPLVGFEIEYVGHAPATAAASLAVGRRASGDGAIATPPTVERGTRATIVLEVELASVDPLSGTKLLPAGRHVIFKGLIDDIGPGNLSQGSFNARVVLVSELALLNSGSLQLAKLAPRTFMDPTNIISAGSGRNTKTVFDGFRNGYWDVLQEAMLEIAETRPSDIGQGGSESLKEYMRKIGNDNDSANTRVAELLRQITGSLRFRPDWLSDESVVKNLEQYHTTQFSGNFRMESFLNRIVNLGQEFKFRLLERPGKVAVVAYSPFFVAGDAYELNPSNIFSATWGNHQPDSCSGIVMVASNPSLARAQGVGNGNATDSGYIVGSHIRPGTNPFGLIVPVPAPGWMGRRLDADGQTLPLTFSTTLAETIGASYCREQALEMGYVGRVMSLQCPLRLDVAPLSAVKINFPSNPHLGLATAVYGSVQSVRLVADAVKQEATTLIEVGYVRSSTQQQAELASYRHPIWDSALQHRHARLIELS